MIAERHVVLQAHHGQRPVGEVPGVEDGEKAPLAGAVEALHEEPPVVRTPARPRHEDRLRGKDPWAEVVALLTSPGHVDPHRLCPEKLPLPPVGQVDRAVPAATLPLIDARPLQPTVGVIIESMPKYMTNM